MSKKLNKLKEIKLQVNDVLTELETQIFIENIDDFKKNIIKEKKT
jgi:phage tail sheath gpL-like